MIRPINLIPAAARLYRSIGDEGRLALLEALEGGALRVTDLVQETGQSQSTVSTHLSMLHAAGLVARQQDGRQVIYQLADPAVEALLRAGEKVVLASSAQEFACTSPCCSDPAEGD
jgi:ArsR family transcriptional regulator, cadmium/lead-responsive transcriptional repressor